MPLGNVAAGYIAYKLYKGIKKRLGETPKKKKKGKTKLTLISPQSNRQLAQLEKEEKEK